MEHEHQWTIVSIHVESATHVGTLALLTNYCTIFK